VASFDFQKASRVARERADAMTPSERPPVSAVVAAPREVTVETDDLFTYIMSERPKYP